MSKKRERERKPHPFYIGMTADQVVGVMKRTGRDLDKQPEVMNALEVDDLLRDSLRVKWSLTCGTALILERGENRRGKPIGPYKVVEVIDG